MRVFEFNGGAPSRRQASFYAYDPAFTGGVSVAAAATSTGDGSRKSSPERERVPGRTCACSAVDGGSVTELASFYAYDPAFSGGVRVASAATPRGEVAMAAAPGSGGRAVNGHDVNGMVLARITDSLAYGLAEPPTTLGADGPGARAIPQGLEAVDPIPAMTLARRARRKSRSTRARASRSRVRSWQTRISARWPAAD